MSLAIKARVTIGFTVTGEQDLDTETDILFQSLLDVERQNPYISESDIMSEFASESITVSVVVRANSWVEVEQRAYDAVSQAIRRAGGEITDENSTAPIEVKGSPAEHLSASVRTTELVPV